MNRELVRRIIAVMSDLMVEATGKGTVQDWGEVNNVLVELEKIAKGEDHVLAIPEQFRTVRKEVIQFALAMEEKLKKNDWKGGWSNESYTFLTSRLQDEANELFAAIHAGKINGTMEEAVDVANFAMMIYDNVSRTKSDKED